MLALRIGCKRIGTTLTEMLVALAIIAILFAMLLPAVQRARQAADDMDIRNDLKQIAVAYNNYAVAKNRGPKTAHDLSPFFENGNRINEQLATGRITVLWGIPPQFLDSYTILAYEAQVDRIGNRLVAMGDASVQTMNQQEFSSSQKQSQAQIR
jgi:prepilin-type N-terminal cleavage/methylation domain-containing protein